jgi:hypothetical protein
MRRLTLAALAASMLAISCSSAQTPPQSAATVIGWALGPGHRAPSPPTGDRELVLLSTPKASQDGAVMLSREALASETKPIGSKCTRATSLIAVPGDSRVFLAINGALYMQQRSGKAAVPLEGFNPSLRITRFLGTATSPLRVLAAVERNNAAAEEVWMFTVNGTTIQATARTDSMDALMNIQKFFGTFSSPKCLPGGKNCLVLTHDHGDVHIDVEPSRGEPLVPFRRLNDTSVHDVAWATSDGKSIYLLIGCPEKAP